MNTLPALTIVSLVTVGLFCERLDGDEDNGKIKANVTRELKRFQGEWVLKGIEIRQNKSTSRILPSTFTGKMVVQGDRVSVFLFIQGDTHDYSYRLKIDPNVKPKQFDEILPKEHPVHGIYAIEGDTLKQCTPNDLGNARPRDFESGQIFLWMRKRPPKNAKPVRGSDPTRKRGTEDVPKNNVSTAEGGGE